MFGGGNVAENATLFLRALVILTLTLVLWLLPVECVRFTYVLYVYCTHLVDD